MKQKIGCLFGTMLVSTVILLINQPVWCEETGQSKEDPVALVNGKAITRELFDFALSNAKNRIAASTGQGLNEEMILEIKKKVLEDIISLELLYQESVAKETKIDEGKANDDYNELKKRFKSDEDYQNALRQQGINEEIVKSQFMRQLVIQRLVEDQYGEALEVTEDEMKEFYNGNRDKFVQPESIHASHILIKVAPDADEKTKGEAKEKIIEIQQKLKQGGDFADLAKEFSECPSASKGGDLGYFGRGAMVKPFEDAAFGLKAGETSDVVETRFGYHLIKVSDKKAESTVSFEDAKERLELYLEAKKREKVLMEYVNKLREKATIKKLISLN